MSNKEKMPDELIEKEEVGQEKAKKKPKDDQAAQKLLAGYIQENEELKKQLDEQKDIHLRLLAEYDNFRKRTASEKSQIYSDTSNEVIEKFLPVLDNLERAAECKVENQEDSAVIAGIELVLKSFREILEKLGVSEIPALGEKFDPNFHNAVMKEDDPEKGENEITAVFQKGYKTETKVIRYSMVKVAN